MWITKHKVSQMLAFFLGFITNDKTNPTYFYWLTNLLPFGDHSLLLSYQCAAFAGALRDKTTNIKSSDRASVSYLMNYSTLSFYRSYLSALLWALLLKNMPVT